MKIDAKVEFDDDVASEIGQMEVKVPVDMDYVFGTKAGVTEWVKNALEEKFGRAFSNEDFTIENLKDIVEDISYDEFCDKVQ